MTRSRRLAIHEIACAIALVVATVLVAAPAQAAGPQFHLLISHAPNPMQGNEPSAFGGESVTYTLTVTNTGDAATSPPIVLTDTLGAGQAFSAVDPGPSFSCSGDASLSTPLTCTRATPLAAGQSDSIQLSAAVAEVKTDETVTAASTVTVSGGGVPDAVSKNYTVRVFPPYAIEYFSARTTTDASEAFEDTVAGGHPFQTVNAFQFTHWGNRSTPNLIPSEDVKDTYVTLPPGFIGNPAAAERCPVPNISGIGEGSNDNCPPGSQVGEVYPALGRALCMPCGSELPLYSIVPDYGFPAQFFARSNTTPVLLSAILRPRTEGYAVSFGSLSASRSSVVGFGARLFGIPSYNGSIGPEAPFLSNSVDCSDAHPTRKLALDTWQSTGAFQPGGLPDTSDPSWLTTTTPTRPVTGCDDPSLAAQFNLVTLAAKPLPGLGPVQADSPAGFAINFDFPQSNDRTDSNTNFDPSVPQTPEPKDITVKLPAGLNVSPSSADGLGACSDLASDPAGDQVHYDTTQPVTCPDSSKIGSATATSPLLAARDPVDDHIVDAEVIPGDVYLLAPHPGDLSEGRDGKFRLLVELENARYGVNVKLPGVAVADKQTGQLTATFTDSPQLPARHLTVNLRSGSRAPLATPVACGKFTTTANLVPWGTPDVPDANESISFDVNSGPNGSGCVSTPGQRPFSPALGTAGTESAKAGAHSPFVLKLTRNDGEQELSTVDLTTPPGFTAKLAGVASCSDTAIAAAESRSGLEEQASPSCPASSRVGTIIVGAGPGSGPYYVQGTAYLAGAYEDAPLSIAFITPAVAGSFDLGNVVIRAGVYLDPTTAQVSVKTDPLPQILDGIPLRLRSLTLHLDRADFTRNPTACEPMSVTGLATAGSHQSIPLSKPFQVGGCANLPFNPTLALNLLGELARNGHPALRAILRAGSDEADVAAATITLPPGQLLDLRHVRALCGRQRAAESCPRASRIGHIRVWSPLLGDPLDGPIYLRAPSDRLPDLLADLRGDGLHFVLHGQTVASGGRLRFRFPALPDAPLSKAAITFTGGRQGIVVNSEGLCGRPRRVPVSLGAHNGDQRQLRPLLRFRGRC